MSLGVPSASVDFAMLTERGTDMSTSALPRALTAAVAVVAAAVLVACSSGASAPTPVAEGGQGASSHLRRTPSTSQFVCISNQFQSSGSIVGSVNYYPVGSSGDVAPSGKISGSNTLITGAAGMVVDASGEIYVANADTNRIVGFAHGSNGNVSPNLLICGSNTGLASPNGLALDDRGSLYVTNCGNGWIYGPPRPTSIEEVAPGSNGNVAPIRTISGSRTNLQVHVNDIYLDGRGYIYVACAGPNVINVYAPHAKGTPHRFASSAAPIPALSRRTASLQTAMACTLLPLQVGSSVASRARRAEMCSR